MNNLPKVKTVTDFLNEDYCEYAIYVVEERAIPSIIDGFKPTQRKIVYVADKIWKNGTEKPLKIFQFAGKVAADAHYTHGDGSLSGAIVGIAQKFKNSMPILEEIGQFGSLRSTEAGAPRYISTKLHNNFRLLYMDFELLTSKFEEGSEIEPEYFLPIIPTVLLNGGSGIAVGFATNILNRNPLDLINCCLRELYEKKYAEPTPWYAGYSGEIVRDVESDLTWIFKGKYTVRNTSTLLITELPPSVTYEKFEIHLSNLEDSGRISGYENNCKSDINYTVKFKREDLKTLQDNGRLLRFLKMEEKQSENFTVLDENGKLKIFTNVIDIIKYFVNFRLSIYPKRKQYIIDKLKHEILILENKARFIKMIIDKQLKINNVPKSEIISSLQAFKFSENDNSYGYLLSLPIHTLTKEKYEELLNTLELTKVDLEIIKKKNPVEMYEEDLNNLKRALSK